MKKTTSFVVVGERDSFRVKQTIAAKTFNVVDYRWILECIERKTYEFPAMQHVSKGSGERDVSGLLCSWWCVAPVTRSTYGCAG